VGDDAGTYSHSTPVAKDETFDKPIPKLQEIKAPSGSDGTENNATSSISCATERVSDGDQAVEMSLNVEACGADNKLVSI
jgi:hypothetical protein